MAISIVADVEIPWTLSIQDAIGNSDLCERFLNAIQIGAMASMTRIQMREIMAGAKWRETCAYAFNGRGLDGQRQRHEGQPRWEHISPTTCEQCCMRGANCLQLVTHTHPDG